MEAPAPLPRPRTRRIAAWLYREALPLLLVLALLVVARASFANHYHVPSGSMQPTLQLGDRVLVDMSAYGVRIPFTRHVLVARGTPQPGEVAVFASPVDGTRLIKRVVAVGGDKVQLLDGRLAINGRVLAAEYLIESAASPAVVDKLSGGFPTGAAALFTVDVAGRCTYEGFLTPRSLGAASA